MTAIPYQNISALSAVRKSLRISERGLANRAGISRSSVRDVLSAERSVSIDTIVKCATAIGHTVTVMSSPQTINSEYSTPAIAMKIATDGFDSWKTHLVELVDEFRRTHDPRLILLPPPQSLPPKLRSLFGATVHALALEAAMTVPNWAQQPLFLPEPWFPAEIENLKAMALLESPFPFRQNNIFVLENFLARA